MTPTPSTVATTMVRVAKMTGICRKLGAEGAEQRAVRPWAAAIPPPPRPNGAGHDADGQSLS